MKWREVEEKEKSGGKFREVEDSIKKLSEMEGSGRK